VPSWTDNEIRNSMPIKKIDAVDILWNFIMNGTSLKRMNALAFADIHLC
jgi:hypothetical protein